MTNYSKVVSKSEIDKILMDAGMGIMDFEYQTVSTAFVYKLPNSNYLLYLSGKKSGLLFYGELHLDEAIENDDFPIESENEFKKWYDYEVERIKEIDKWVNYYENIARNRSMLKYPAINQENFYDFLDTAKILYRDGVLKPDEIIAVVAVAGEFVRTRLGGRWVLRKWYNDYNPSFEPMLIDSVGKMIPLYETIIDFFETNEYPHEILTTSFFKPGAFVNRNIFDAIESGVPYQIL